MDQRQCTANSIRVQRTNGSGEVVAAYDYDPSIGRFINEDPAPDGHNWYIYDCSTVGVGAVLGWRIRIFRFCLITTIEEQGSTGKAGDLVRH